MSPAVVLGEGLSPVPPELSVLNHTNVRALGALGAGTPTNTHATRQPRCSRRQQQPTRHDTLHTRSTTVSQARRPRRPRLPAGVRPGRMADVPRLHAQATRLILSLREGLERLEGAEHGLRPGDPALIARDLQQKLSELQRTSRDLDSTWRMQMVRESAARRDVWKRKVEQVSEEADFLRLSLDRFGGRQVQRQQEAADRDELLARAELGRAAKNEMDEEAAVAGHVGRSRRYLAEMYDQGGAILANMAGNRDRIKKAQKKMLDVINSVGLSGSMLKVIERRHKSDAYLALGSMGVVVLLTGGLIWWKWL